MKLLSTLTQIDVDTPAGKGSVGGELRLFFTTLNHADAPVPTPDPFEWSINSPAIDTYTLKTGEVISLALNLASETGSGNLFILGTISVTVPGGPGFDARPMGQSITPYLPGKAAKNTQNGAFQSVVGNKQLDVGFELDVPWDGTSANCHGKWWAKWK